MAEVVFRGVTDEDNVQGTLFSGKKFWLSQKVPQRSRFLNDVRANGGEVLALEKHADVKIVDHARKEALPGTYSYTYIERSIRNGVLEDLEDHRVGPSEGTVRSVGSVIQPAKQTRNKYSEADDRILWDWVHENPQKSGGTDGNEIYKQLEAKHPQHPWQSWRDRWVKNLKGKPKAFAVPHNAPPTPPSDNPATIQQPRVVQELSDTIEDEHKSFLEADAEALMAVGDEIVGCHGNNVPYFWDRWAQDRDAKVNHHTAQQWQSFWEDLVRPRYLRRMAKQATNRSNKHTVSLPAQDRNSPQRPDADPPLDISSFNKKDVPVRPAYRRPFYHPESPRCSSLDPSFVQQTTAENSMAAPSIKGLTSPDVGELEGTPKKTLAADHGSVKRKHVVVEDDLPSSSPLGPIFTPKCRRRNGSEWPLEIPSTPDASPANKIRKSSPPLFIDLDLEENMLGLEGDSPEEDDRQLDQQPPDTLSEPDRQDPDTQAVFTDATQPIDFNVIPPEDGWDDEDNEYEKTSNLNRFDIPPTRVGWDTSPRFHTSSLHIADTELSDLQPVLADTQAILKDKTQTPDFSIPDPDDGWNNLIRLSPPPVPNSPHAKSDESSAANNEQFDAWLDSHVTKSISVEQVENVLKCTNMNTSLADDVLRYLAKKGHVPKNRKGVWTAADDEDLKSTNARKIQKLQEKHGAECLAARWEFLDFYAGA